MVACVMYDLPESMVDITAALLFSIANAEIDDQLGSNWSKIKQEFC